MISGRSRLAVASAVALVLIAALGTVGWSQLRASARDYEALVDRDARLTRDVLELRSAIGAQSAAARLYLLSRGDAEALDSYRRAIGAFARALREARDNADDDEELRRLQTIEARHATLEAIHRRELSLVDAGRFDAAVDLARERGLRARAQAVDSLNALIGAEAGDLYRDRREAVAVRRSAELAILGVLVLALVAGSAATFAAIRAARRRAGAQAEVEAARRAAAEEAAVARIATAIAHEEEPQAVLASAAREAADLLGAASAAILRFQSGERSAIVVGVAGRSEMHPGQRLGVEGRDILGFHRIEDVPGEPAPPTGDGSAPPGELGVPIRVGGEAWGAICVTPGPGVRLDDDAADRLVRFADLASASITSADARAHLAQLALEDSLTGLANHRLFHERLRAEVARAQRHGRALSVVLLDIDHFKEVNDLHGHHVGDLVLREAADRLAACARSGELVARVGGEQFGWILPEAGSLDAYQAAERARRSLGGEPLAGVVRVTVSAGVCDLEHATSSAQLVRFADGALFWAKAHGRDITFRYSPDVVTELSADEQLEHLRRTRTILGIRALARAVDVKDRSTARHSERVAELSVAIARALGWDDVRIGLLHEAALVHDVGKIGVPDAILLKPSRLEPDEYDAIKQHATLSAEIVNDVLSDEQVAWVLGHHERFDGRGYPNRLVGHDIPAGARILAMADAWDVMTSDRSYSPARNPEEALAEARAEAGRQFCPAVVRAMELVVRQGDTAGLATDPGV